MKIAILLLAMFGFIAINQAFGTSNEETEQASAPDNRALANDNHWRRVVRSPNHHNSTANTGRQRKAKAGGKGNGKGKGGGGGRGGSGGNAGAGAGANAGFGMNAGAGAKGGAGAGGGGGK